MRALPLFAVCLGAGAEVAYFYSRDTDYWTRHRLGPAASVYVRLVTNLFRPAIRQSMSRPLTPGVQRGTPLTFSAARRRIRS